MINWPYFPYAFALLLALPFLIYLRQFVFSYIKLKNKELKLNSVKGLSEQRVHAYERLTLFLERLKPSNLVLKFDAGLAPHEFLFLTEKTINEEFDYNLSQQLYLSKTAWTSVVEAKTIVLQLLHKTYGNLSTKANLEDFKTVFLINYMNDSDVVSETLELLRRENLTLN